MSDTIVAAAATRFGLAAWLRYDDSLVPAVEDAYGTYIRVGRPGVFALIGVFGGLIVALLTGAFVTAFAKPALMLPTVMITFVLACYGTLVVPALRCPRESFIVLFKGCTDLKRTCILSASMAFFISVLELSAIAALEASHVPTPKHLPDVFIGGVVFGTFLTVVVAPIAEELLVQGWFQTRMRRLGGFWSAVVATLFFILIHFPTNPYDFVRGGNLAFAAALRSSTRSHAACMVAHAVNNAFFIAIVIAAKVFVHHAGKR